MTMIRLFVTYYLTDNKGGFHDGFCNCEVRVDAVPTGIDGIREIEAGIENDIKETSSISNPCVRVVNWKVF